MLSYNLPFFVLLFYPKSSRLYHRNRHFSTPYAKKMYKTNSKYFFWIFLIFLNFSIDIIQFLSYYKWAVDERSKQSEASRLKKCRNGGIGRRAGFRCLWSQDRVGSSPISCIIFFLLLRIPELRIRLAVRHRMSLLFRLGSSSFFSVVQFFSAQQNFFLLIFCWKKHFAMIQSWRFRKK